MFKRLLGSGQGTRIALGRAGTCHRTMRARIVSGVTGVCCALVVLSHRLRVAGSATRVLGGGTRAVRTVGSTTVCGVGSANMRRDGTTCTRILTDVPSVRRDVHRARGTLSAFLNRTPRTVGHNALRTRMLPARLSTNMPVRLLSGHPSMGTTRVTLTDYCCGAGSTHTTFCPRVALDNSTK